MNKARQHNYRASRRTRYSINYEHNKVEYHTFATTSIWRVFDIRRFPMRRILN